MKAFISYSHQDADLLTELHKHLAALRRQNLLEMWTDREIHPGGVIDQHIQAAMGEAQLFIFLISASFINSNYCFETEFARACQRHDAGEVIIVPVILRECDWNIPELRRFKALPQDGKAVISRHWHTQDEAFANIAEGLRRLLEHPPTNLPTTPLPKTTSTAQTQGAIAFTPPALPAAKELLDMILAHPVPQEMGLTEILVESPTGPLDMCFIPNTTASGSAPTAKKSLLRPAIAELMRLGWLLPPEGNGRVRVYELNPEAYPPLKA